ncbi:MAG: DNA repair protein RadA, partial [Gammaproteobacteria bacterium RIFOXYB2_FULL_38_6]
MKINMIKTKTKFICQQCGNEFSKWQGQCTACHAWNTLVEEVVMTGKTKHAQAQLSYAVSQSDITLLKNVSLNVDTRLSTGLEEFDRVLGGGMVSDSVVLIGGDPGIGKSTLLLQVLCQLADRLNALYITGEESLQQVALRASRLGLSVDHLKVLAETNVERILALSEKENPRVLVIDSIQTAYTDFVSAAPGSVSQLKESTAQLVRYAKQKGIALFLVGHVTKSGALAGPRILEHMVDTVLYFEGERDGRFRIVRAVKNRFGTVNELGVFAMTDKGLKQVSNPSAIFLSQHPVPVSGSVVMSSWEGSRPLLVEVQALLDESHAVNPRRVTLGLDYNRLSMLLAVLHRHAGIITYDQDVFVNVVGGLRVVETAADLAVMMAILSSLKNKPLTQGLIVFGEVGLSGEIRPVPGGQERLKEAVKHGFTKAIV